MSCGPFYFTVTQMPVCSHEQLIEIASGWLDPFGDFYCSSADELNSL